MAQKVRTITKEEAQAAVNVLCEKSADVNTCDAVLFQNLQEVIDMLIKNFDAEWPFK